MRKKLVIGNWKMNGGLARNAALLAELAAAPAETGVDCAVCVPFPYLGQAKDALVGSPLSWGAQNVAAAPSGAYTGEVSAGMLADFGCTWVLVGHSERRALFGEQDAAIADKLRLALAAGLTPVLCVGETLAEREAGRADEIVAAQLDGALAQLSADTLAKLVVAYEPVWAIGTGVTATPAQAQAMHAFVRARIAALAPDVAATMRLLYGGSVTAANARELFSEADIDGGLVGGASLASDSFLAIRAAAAATT